MQMLSLFQNRLAPHIRTGKKGERTAMRFLRRLGYSILLRNVRVGRHDEIDILAWDPSDRVIVFAEVKSRSKEDPDYRPELNLTPSKRQALFRAARRWISENGYNGGFRIDFLCVVAGDVREHVRDLESVA